MSVEHLSAGWLNGLANYLGAVEDWLRESCTARNSDSMADAVGKAVTILEDLYDEAHERETGEWLGRPKVIADCPGQRIDGDRNTCTEEHLPGVLYRHVDERQVGDVLVAPHTGLLRQSTR